jgi:hypothetical protein
MQTLSIEKKNLYCPNRWGLPATAVADLSARLHRFWRRFHHCFTTRTRDSSLLAHDYLRAQLTIERARNFTKIERRLNGGDGQRLQHFMSYSPWSGAAVFQQIRHEIISTPELRDGGTLLLDESADEKAGGESAGVSRRYNGRMGKVRPVPRRARALSTPTYNNDDGRWLTVNCSSPSGGSAMSTGRGVSERTSPRSESLPRNLTSGCG